MAPNTDMRQSASGGTGGTVHGGDILPGMPTATHRAVTHPRDEIVEALDRIYRYRMTTTSGGNISVRDETGDIWITPARVDKGSLGRGDIVRLRADGVVEGRHKASSEHPFHQAIYRARPDIG